MGTSLKKICGRCSRGKQFSQDECTCHAQMPYSLSPDVLWPLVRADDFCPAFEIRSTPDFDMNVIEKLRKEL